MSDTIRQDNSGEPFDNGTVSGEKWVDDTTNYSTVTTRTDAGSDPVEVPMDIRIPKKRLG